MRAIFVGASATTVTTVQSILKHGGEVVIVEKDKNKVDALKQTLDCGFIQGDGSKPAILKELQITESDVLFALTDNDQTNILTCLVGRSLGVERTITKIDDPELEHVCLELGLSDTIIPSRTIGRYLTDKYRQVESFELSTVLRSDSRIFTFVVNETAGDILANDLNLPSAARIICIYRDDKLLIPDEDTKLKDDDEVIVIAHEKSITKLKELYGNNKDKNNS